MLILGRRANQSIVFPNCGITVRILDVNGRVAKIGIDAHRNIEVIRGELVTASGSSEVPQPVNGLRGAPQSYEQSDAPDCESLVMQFSQRIADIKSNLHIFQQLRSVGNESGADEVLAELLEDLATLDNDCLATQLDRDAGGRSSNELVGESPSGYEYYASKERRPQYLLIINSNAEINAGPSATIAVHGCQTCTVNTREAAVNAVASDELFDYIIFNCGEYSFDEVELLRTIRSSHRFDGTKVLIATSSQNVLERFVFANQHGIDGWIDQPLCSQNLWNHIVEIKRFED